MNEKQETLKMNYEEWLKNYEDENWSGWKTVEAIASTVGKSTNPKANENMRVRALQFLNNYLLEKEVKRILNLEWYGDDHLEFREGKGHATPDFRTKDGRTAELKNTQNRYYFDLNQKENRLNWHGADIKIVYLREEGKLYIVHPDNLEELCYFRIKKCRLPNNIRIDI